MIDDDSDSDEARVLRPLQAAACSYHVAFGPRAARKLLAVQGAIAAVVRNAPSTGTGDHDELGARMQQPEAWGRRQSPEILIYASESRAPEPASREHPPLASCRSSSRPNEQPLHFAWRASRTRWPALTMGQSSAFTICWQANPWPIVSPGATQRASRPLRHRRFRL
jgi:hypothetical protein